MDWKHDDKHGYRIDRDKKSCVENDNNMIPLVGVLLQNNNENKAVKLVDDVDGGKIFF